MYICPAGARHLLLYSRRYGNGSSPHMRAFMDFWMERGVDIWDFGYIDKMLDMNRRNVYEYIGHVDL